MSWATSSAPAWRETKPRTSPIRSQRRWCSRRSAQRREYEALARKVNPGSIINHLKAVAERFMISPITVFEQVRQYARATHQPALALDRKAIYPAATNFNKQFYTIRETLFDGEEPTASSYIKKSEEIFGTPFFKALSGYLRDAEAGAGYVQAILNTSLVDAKAITAELG